MNILGVSWNICSGAASYSNNRLSRAVSEERFSREKNDDRFPLRSIQYCMEGLESKTSELDGIALASHVQGYWNTLKRKSAWSIEDYLTEQKEYWYPTLVEARDVHPLDYLNVNIDTEQYPPEFWEKSLRDPTLIDNFDKIERKRIVAEALGVHEALVETIEHHRCHAYYAYYTSPYRQKNIPVLVFTIDGWGDYCNATINIFNKNGSCQRVFSSTEANIGRIYRYMTLLLGMKPNEHEYKLMGLSPYCKKEIAKKPYDLFKSTLYVDDIEFKWKEKPTDSYFWFKERLEGRRFDGIAAGLQQWCEDILCEWVRNAVNKFGIRTIALSGGVAMNVKANGKIACLPEVESIFVPGSASDDSLAIGAVFAMNDDLNRKQDKSWSSTDVAPVYNIYLGPENKKSEEVKAIRALDQNVYETLADFTPDMISKLLANGNIIARCAGRMEFGQRSLGNRSILADPIHTHVIHRINEAIKNRDFWMPFAPLVIDLCADQYIAQRKNNGSPYMMFVFETTLKGWNDFPAACHQADHTARPQILTEMSNPELYKIIRAFYDLTGRGALLNTSFNFHGFPIVNTVHDAVDCFVKSDLDILLLNNFLIKKRCV